MNNNYENDEITINLKKIYKILEYRKKILLGCVASFIILFLLITFILPKKYESEAKLLINKAESTNLADINPFIVSQIGSAGDKGLSALLSSGGNLGNELEILKSELVLNPVIKENNIRYKKGKKKGELLSVKDFIKKNAEFSNISDTNIIRIVYKSSDPKVAYNVVNSIIKHYKEIYEGINIKRASKDIEFLEESYLNAQADVQEKIDKLKSFYKNNKATGDTASLNSILSLYDKRLNKDAAAISEANIDLKKAEAELNQEIEKLKMLKQKYEWVTLIQEMSKNASNLIVLKEPNFSQNFENTEPNLVINLILGTVLSLICGFVALITFEAKDSKLTYSALGENISYNEDDLNSLKLIIASKSDQSFAVVNFTSQNLGLDKFSNVKLASVYQLQDVINQIKQSDKVILAGTIGATPKKQYESFKSLCKELNKEIYREILV